MPGPAGRMIRIATLGLQGTSAGANPSLVILAVGRAAASAFAVARWAPLGVRFCDAQGSAKTDAAEDDPTFRSGFLSKLGATAGPSLMGTPH